MNAFRNHFLFAMVVGAQFLWPPWASEARANISEAAVLFLTITNSARANGMGSCSVNLTDAQSALYNPGALGLFHMDHVASISAPSNTHWLPTLADDLELKTMSVSGGVPLGSLNPGSSESRLSFGFAYSRQRLNLGTQTRTDEAGNVLGTFGTYETANLFTGSLGLNISAARLGVGATIKRVHSHLADFGAGVERGSGTADVTALDWGLLFELPLADIISKLRGAGVSEQGWGYALTPSVAYVNANSGSDVAYIDAAQADPLPHISRLGLSLYLAGRYKGAVALSGRFVWQQNRSLVGLPDEQNPEGSGWEIGLLNIAYFRMGRYEDVQGDIFMDTRGYGFSLGGLMKWLNVLTEGSMSPGLHWVFNHVDLTYDYSKYEPDTLAPLTDTRFSKIGISIR